MACSCTNLAAAGAVVFCCWDHIQEGARWAGRRILRGSTRTLCCVGGVCLLGGGYALHLFGKGQETVKTPTAALAAFGVGFGCLACTLCSAIACGVREGDDDVQNLRRAEEALKAQISTMGNIQVDVEMGGQLVQDALQRWTKDDPLLDE